MPAGIVDDYSLSSLVISVDLKMSDMSVGNGFMNIHTLSKQYLDLNNDDVSCGNGFINWQTLYQCNDSISFNDMVRDVKNGCVSGGHSSMDSQTLYQNNVLKPLII